MRPIRLLRVVAPVWALALLFVACPEPQGPDEQEPEPLQINTTSLPMATLGIAYTAGVDAEGGDGEYDWELQSGALPPGLAMSIEDLTDDDLVITGIPEQAGTFNFSLRVESDDEQTRTRAFSITVQGEAPGLTVLSVARPPGLAGASYNTRLQANGGDGENYTWTLESGTLPAGLTLDADGDLHGTPTATDTSALVLRVESGGNEATATLTLQVVGNRTNAYNITVVPVVPIPTAFQPVVDAAIAAWEEAITGDLGLRSIAPGTFDPPDCGGFGSVVNGTSTDDLIVLVNIGPIDGQGQVLGFAGPCLVRSPGNLPIVGVLTLDAVDLGFLNTNAQIALVTHEIGHVIGFGSMWDTFDLVSTSTSDPRYLGGSANNEWNAIGGTGNAHVENQGGQGTARSHWRESTFGAEIMTGFSNTNVFQPMSRITIASFDDMGYTVNLNAADAFTLAPPQGAPGAAAASLAGYDIVLDDIVGAVDENGRVTPVPER